jgi:16S rRNA (guanine527-N7)-methyltransferase
MQDFRKAVFAMLDVELDAEQLERFEMYAGELVEWNQRFNLTTITDPEQIHIRHFLDSLSCWQALRQAPPGRLVDVGAGAGFPGLALKILQPEMQLTLVESTAKKASFLEHIVQVLGLRDVRVLAQRAEDVGRIAEERGAYDWAVARAVAPMAVLAEYLLPLVGNGGFALAQKAKGAKQEVNEAANAIAKLGGEVKELIRVEIPELNEERWLVVVKKTGETSAEYPRRAGMPSKRPL